MFSSEERRAAQNNNIQPPSPLDFRRQSEPPDVEASHFGLTVTHEVYPLTIRNERQGEVRFYLSDGRVSRVELIDASEAKRVGIPTGFSVELTERELQERVSILIPRERGEAVDLKRLHKCIEECRVTAKGMLGGVHLTRYAPVYVKEPTTHPVNVDEDFVEYIDRLAASVADWCAGTERLEKRLVRRDKSFGMTTAEALLVVNRFADGSSVSEFKVLDFRSESRIGEQIISKNVTARSGALTDAVSESLDYFYHQLKQHSLQDAISEIAPRRKGETHVLRANSVNLSAQMEHEIPAAELPAQTFPQCGEHHLVSGGVIRWDARVSPEKIAIRSGTAEGSSYIEFVASGTRNSRESILQFLSYAHEGTVRSCQAFLRLCMESLSVRMVDSHCTNKREVIHLIEGVSPFPSTMPAATFPIEKESIRLLAESLICGHDWFGFSDLRFGRETICHGARYAQSIFFQGWSGGIHRIALQIPGGSLVVISPSDPLNRDTEVLSSERSFVRGDIGAVRDFIFNQLFLFHQDPLRLIQLHVTNGASIVGGAHNIYTNTGLSQAQFLSQLLIVDREKRNAETLLLGSDLHGALASINRNSDVCVGQVWSDGDFTVHVEVGASGLRHVYLTKAQGLIKQAVSRRRLKVLSEAAVLPEVGALPERSHALLASIVDYVRGSSKKERRSRHLKKLIPNKLADLAASYE